jgi:hypothetical protein
LQPPNLQPISESPLPKVRTEVRLTVDKKGRARTETVVIGGEEEAAATTSNRSYDSDHYESSTDEEEIIIPSRNASFALPPQTKGPKLARFETGARDVRRHSISASNSYSESSSQHSMGMDGAESEAETVMEEDDGSGDATRALRKVLENRKKEQMKQRNPQHHRYSDNRRGSRYMGYTSSSNMSPTTVADPEEATPSSTRSGTTRCVCGSQDSEGFMIQW